MTHPLNVSTSVALAAILAFPISDALGNNVVQNPGFEFTGPNGQITHWQLFNLQAKQAAGCTIAQESTNVYDGNYSLNTSATGVNSTNYECDVVSDYYSIVGGSAYLLTEYFYGPGVGESDLSVDFYDSNLQSCWTQCLERRERAIQ